MDICLARQYSVATAWPPVNRPDCLEGRRYYIYMKPRPQVKTCNLMHSSIRSSGNFVADKYISFICGRAKQHSLDIIWRSHTVTAGESFGVNSSIKTGKHTENFSDYERIFFLRLPLFRHLQKSEFVWGKKLLKKYCNLVKFGSAKKQCKILLGKNMSFVQV